MSPIAPHAADIAKAAIDAGHPVPDDAIAPDVPAAARFAYAAFNELMTDCAIGMVHGPIPFTAIDAYAARYRIHDLDEFDRFRVLIRAIERQRNASP